jgi:glyoxylase-like metal-dependent hydrolase (beta-lactamase superfamily II)
VSIEPFEIIALKYAHLGGRKASDRFIIATDHDTASDLDYFVWVIKRGDEVYLADTGFAQPAATERGRTLIRNPIESLKPLLGIDAAELKDVIVTHLHYDHAGNLDKFAKATFHLQDKDMAYATGRQMCHKVLRHPFDVEDMVKMIRHVYGDRVIFHEGEYELAPGLTVHWVGGHSAGLQICRVWTKRGWVVVASDATHFYANFQQRRPFPIVYNLGEMLEGYNLLYKLADSPDHIIPGHDPLVMKYYPAVSKELEGIAVRLDVAPKLS